MNYMSYYSELQFNHIIRTPHIINHIIICINKLKHYLKRRVILKKDFSLLGFCLTIALKIIKFCMLLRVCQFNDGLENLS